MMLYEHVERPLRCLPLVRMMDSAWIRSSCLGVDDSCAIVSAWEETIQCK